MPSLDLEQKLLNEHPEIDLVAGLDEVGVAAFAGPLVAAAVILPPSYKEWFDEIDDSKNLTAETREQIATKIRNECIWGIGVATSTEVDKVGPHKARAMAMRRALSQCKINAGPVFVGAVIDGADLEKLLPDIWPAVFINQADATSLSVAAASILAKVARDAYMRGLAMLYPNYKFETNVGYGTPEHKHAIKKYGICPEHRLRWRPVKALYEEWGSD